MGVDRTPVPVYIWDTGVPADHENNTCLCILPRPKRANAREWDPSFHRVPCSQCLDTAPSRIIAHSKRDIMRRFGQKSKVPPRFARIPMWGISRNLPIHVRQVDNYCFHIALVTASLKLHFHTNIAVMTNPSTRCATI